MRDDMLVRIGVLPVAIATLWLAPVAAAAQPQTPSAAPQIADADSAWVAPRTPWGSPDLQGTWTNETITPFERPASLAGKAFLTQEEAAELEKRTVARREEADRAATNFASYNNFWLDSGTEVVSTRQTSLVVDPSDGRVPVRPEAEATRDANLARSADSYEYMSVWDRCITRGVPGSMFPAGYNNAYRILQTPDSVVILYEMIHDARIIPLDGRPHVASTIRLWMGDARGRWEGDTLIVETTNFTDKGWIASNAASARIKGIPQSEALHVVERFRRIDTETIHYEATIEDPAVYMRPWKVAFPLKQDPAYQIFEYACHEGNRAVENILSGGRAADGATTKPR